MQLFDKEIERVMRYAKYSESHYRFMNISDKPGYAALRKKIEEWFSTYPKHDQAEFIARFKSENNEQFLAAFFELLLYVLLKRLNYSIKIHPQLRNSNKRPDFLVTNNEDEEFYLEIAISTNMSTEEIGRKKVFNTILDIINEINTSDFSIRILINKLPNKSIPAGNLRNFLQNQLDKLNPDYCADMINKSGWDSIPTWNFNYDGFEIEFKPIPKDKNQRQEKIESPIEIIINPFKFFESKKPIITTLKTKAKKYKDLGKPYIIAINTLDSSIRQLDFFEALFGPMTYKMGIKKSFISSDNLSGGFWYTKKGPTYTRVSAVILTQGLSPWSIGMEEFKIYHNPWAKFPYSGNLNLLPRFMVKDNIIDETDGISINQILDIPEKWPHNLA